MDPRLNIAIDAARKAGRLISRSIDRIDEVKIDEKKRNDFVTNIDKKSEEVIIDTIKQAYPDHAILAEESGPQGSDENVWVIDPLDGTMNFIHGFPHVAISIALRVNGRLEVGVVYDPLRNEIFSAARGKGAHLNGRRMRVSDLSRLDGAFLGTGFPFRAKQHLTTYLTSFEKLFHECSGIRRAGAAALDLAYVACGRLDGFWEVALEEWDMAAGALLIKEAGGIVGDIKGEENYLINGSIIAGNPKVFKAMLQNLQPFAKQFLG